MMCIQKSFIASIAALLLCTSPAISQCNDNPPIPNDLGLAITVVDGAITLTGTIKGLAGIEASSEGGYLSLDSVELEGGERLYLKEPFSAEDGNVVQNNPNSIVLGVLGADKRIDLEGVTKTSILYSESQAVADVDLVVQLGTDDRGIVAGCATIRDGELTLHGYFARPSSMKVESSGGFLSLDTADDGASVLGPFTEIGVNTNTSVALNVADRAFPLQGNSIGTGVLYSASGSMAAAGDLQVSLGFPPGFGFPSGLGVAVRVVPEPNTGWMACLAALGLLHSPMVRRGIRSGP